jgi:Methyl-accepting chemotaxis protein
LSSRSPTRWPTCIAYFILRGTHKQLGKDPGELNNVALRVVDGDYNIDDGGQHSGVYKSIVAMVATLKQHIDHAKEESQKAQAAAEQAHQAQEVAEAATARAETARKEGLLDAAAQLESIVNVIASASEELSAQIGQSSHGAEQQANRIADTATAVEEMNATVLEVAKNAGAGANLSASTQSKAKEGDDVTTKCRQAMTLVTIIFYFCT